MPRYKFKPFDAAAVASRFPEPLRLWTFRVVRDDKMIEELESEARTFLAELDEMVGALRRLGRMDEAA